MAINITTNEAREMENAELRWMFCKTFIEPHIKDASNDPTALGLLPNHEMLIRDPSPALCIVKCRKTAHSWGIALKALSRAATEPRSTTIIGSYDEDEAREKLNFLDWQYAVLPGGIQRELRMSDGSEIRKFANGSRIRFLARKTPTGPGASIEWDEFSVEAPGRVTAADILIAAFGCTTHTGTVSIGGTQRGADTLFNKIVIGDFDRDLDEDPVYQAMFAGRGVTRKTWKIGEFPWWTSPALSKDPIDAAQFAANMSTEDRVAKYGNDKLIDQYFSYSRTPDVGIEMFQREFEMMVLDDKESYFDLSLIQSCYALAGRDYWFRHKEIEGIKYNRNGNCLGEAKGIIDQLARAIASRELEGDWGFAMDVGMDHDQDEIWIGHTTRINRDMFFPRLNIGANLLPFDGKEELLHYMFSKLPITRGYLDATKGSLAVQLSQRMFQRYGQRAAPFIFNKANKQILASGLKAKMQLGNLPLPPKTPKYGKLESQMLKIKKIISASGNVLFDIDRNKGQHGDCFWSLAMLNELCTKPATWRPQKGAVGSYGATRALPGRSTAIARRL